MTMTRLSLVVALLFAGCTEPPRHPLPPPTPDTLDIVARAAGRLPLTLTVRTPGTVCVPPAHGGLSFDGTWMSDAPVKGRREGTMRLLWDDGDELRIELQPPPRDTTSFAPIWNEDFAAYRSYDAEGPLRWEGHWFEWTEGRRDTVGTVTIEGRTPVSDCP